MFIDYFQILRDVCKKGDTYFNTGDLLVTDSEYFLYFSDRIGDTFRYCKPMFLLKFLSSILNIPQIGGPCCMLYSSIANFPHTVAKSRIGPHINDAVCHSKMMIH